MKVGMFSNHDYKIKNKTKIFRKYTIKCIHLEHIIPRLDVGDVHPLAVDVMSVSVPAPDCDALLTKVGAFVFLFNAWLKDKEFIQPAQARQKSNTVTSWGGHLGQSLSF